jgi:hypothetical protein
LTSYLPDISRFRNRRKERKLRKKMLFSLSRVSLLTKTATGPDMDRDFMTGI